MNNSQQKIIPHLWFNDQAEEAVEFYTSLFEDSKIGNVTRYAEAGQEVHGQEPGSVMTMDFELAGYKMIALNGGPHFTFTPSISFILNFDPSNDRQAETKLEQIWEKLIAGGTSLMELGRYPFSSKYGWLKDKFGLSWQLILSDPEGEDRPFIIPSLMFSGENTNKAEEAINFYTSVFEHSKVGHLARYPEDTGPAKKGALMFGDFMIEDTWLAAMDSGVEQDFTFNEAISLLIECESQQEIDHFWQLSSVPEAEQCGWLKDKFGVSWQVNPTVLQKMLADPDSDKVERVTDAFLQMKKFDIQKLQDVYEGNTVNQ